MRDVLDCQVQVRGVEGGYGADPDALERTGGGVVPPAEGDPAAGARARRRARAGRSTATAAARRYRGRCCATVMATMTGFGKRRMRLIS